jgi:hypothetical protein
MKLSAIASVPSFSCTKAARSRSFSSSSTTEAWAMPSEASSVRLLTMSGKPSALGRCTGRPRGKTAKPGVRMRW